MRAAIDLWDDLTQRAKSLFEVDIPAVGLQRLTTFVALLRAWSAKVNLVSAESLEDIVHRHVLDSFAPVLFLGSARKVVDFGSGAGFPGIPLAVLRSSISFSLVESRRRRSNFLRYVVRTLPLDNVVVAEDRAEKFAEAHEGEFDAAIGRAIRTDLLMSFARNVLNPGGVLILMRKVGSGAVSEEGFTKLGRREYELPGGFHHEVVALVRESM